MLQLQTSDEDAQKRGNQDHAFRLRVLLTCSMV